MLIISKPTQFGPDGFAVRGQCSPDSPGWRLRWFERGQPLALVWQGAFKTCRHLQAECAGAGSAAEAERMAEDLLKSNAFTHFASMPTDTYPAARGGDPADRPSGMGVDNKKKRRRKKR